jgi:hypothetical protein
VFLYAMRRAALPCRQERHCAERRDGGLLCGMSGGWTPRASHTNWAWFEGEQRQAWQTSQQTPASTRAFRLAKTQSTMRSASGRRGATRASPKGRSARKTCPQPNRLSGSGPRAGTRGQLYHQTRFWLRGAGQQHHKNTIL